MQGKYGEADSLYHRVQEILGATMAKEHPNYASMLNSRAGLLERQVRGVQTILIWLNFALELFGVVEGSPLKSLTPTTS